jgi:hypothetical protein
METIQWTMTIPKDKQKSFIKFYGEIMRPTWLKFGASRCELFKTYREKILGKNSFLEEQFVEMLYLEEGITAQDFFERVKAAPKAWEISRQYENKFGAKSIIMKVLRETKL